MAIPLPPPPNTNERNDNVYVTAAIDWLERVLVIDRDEISESILHVVELEARVQREVVETLIGRLVAADDFDQRAAIYADAITVPMNGFWR